MKFYLINPDYMAYGDPPLGLAYLAGYIRKKHPDIDLKIIDQKSEDEIISEIKRFKPELIGLSAVSANYYMVKELASKIKTIYPDSILILGGVHITTLPESFKNSVFDIAVRGEGEIPTVALIDSIKKHKKIDISSLSKIKGLLIKNKNKIIDTGRSEQIQNLDELPLPARDLLNMKYYLLPRFSSEDEIEPIAAILTSRGCPYSCKFCSTSSFWGRNVRFFSAGRVVDEIDMLHRKYNYSRFFIYDDLFSINKERLRKIVSGLKEKKLLGKITFSVYGRANCFDEETASLLKKMNVKEITFGFETASQRMLDYLKGQGIKLEDGERAVRLAKKYNLGLGGFFMIGSPTENLEDVKKTYNFIKKYSTRDFSINQTIPFPGTEIWDYAIKNKIITPDFYDKRQKNLWEIDPNLLLSKDLSKKDFVKYFFKMKNLHPSKKLELIKKIMKIRPRHIKAMLSPEFLKKANILKDRFFD